MYVSTAGSPCRRVRITSYLIQNKTCPTCKSKMYFVNEKFKAPKKSDDKEWKIIEYLLLSGYDFRNPYCGQEQCIYFEFPKNLQEAEAFIREMRQLK